MDTTTVQGKVKYCLGVALLIVVLGVVVAATSSCARDVWVDAPRIEGEDASWEDDAYAPLPEESDDIVAEVGADAEEDDCGGPWGCKKYPLRVNECETDEDCGDGFVCDVPSTQCVPVEPGKHYLDVTEQDVGEADVGSSSVPLDVVQYDNEEECHCGVGYVCEDGACVPVEQIPEPEPDVVEDSAANIEDVFSDVQNNGENTQGNGDVAPDESEDPAADVAAGAEDNGSFDSADLAPEDSTDSEQEAPFNGAKCTITCPAEYEKVRVWWAFTSADVANGVEFSIPKQELCKWGQMAFEYNCFTPDGPWGDYLKAKVSCLPDDYELVDTGVHGRVEFGESCW